jgi:hypothetical protein
MAQLIVPNGAQERVISNRTVDKNLAICVDQPKEANMAKGEQRGNREAKKPKKQKIKVIAAAPSQKAAAWQPNFASGKKK